MKIEELRVLAEKFKKDPKNKSWVRRYGNNFGWVEVENGYMMFGYLFALFVPKGVRRNENI